MRIDEAGRLTNLKMVNFNAEYQNPTGGQTMIVDLSNGQKQFVPVLTATSLVVTGATGPGNYVLRVYHAGGSSILSWPTGSTGRVNWPSMVVDRGSTTSGAMLLYSLYAVGVTGPNAGQYYAQGGGAAFG